MQYSLSNILCPAWVAHIFSWPGFRGLFLSCFFFSLVILLHMVYFAFFPIVLFTLSTSGLFPSREAVHCHRYSRFFSLQSVILHLRNLLFIAVLPSTVKSSPPPTSYSLQGKYLHFLYNSIQDNISG